MIGVEPALNPAFTAALTAGHTTRIDPGPSLADGLLGNLEAAGLRIVGQKRIKMSQAQAEDFYGVHKERPFFASLVSFMTSGPVVVQVLQGVLADVLTRAVAHHHQLGHRDEAARLRRNERLGEHGCQR